MKLRRALFALGGVAAGALRARGGAGLGGGGLGGHGGGGLRQRGVRTSVLHAALLDCDAAGVARGAELLAAGGLVAFPTETVYGLGANALDETSVAAIFTAKQRPVSDPLIVHIVDKSDMYPLFAFATPEAQRVCETLCDAFWPGPLTIIHKASAAVPSLVTAGTGYVGLRSPQHPLARALLRACNIPIAAPSANRFGHVSPTSAAHVLADLGHVPGLLVLRDDAGSTGGCRVGIESTVCRVAEDGGAVEVLRTGAVTGAMLGAALGPKVRVGLGAAARRLQAGPGEGQGQGDGEGAKAGAGGGDGKKGGRETKAEAKGEGQGEGEGEGAVAPGQMLKHYSPDLPTYIYSPQQAQQAQQTQLRLPLSQCLVLDFGCSLLPLAPLAAQYHDLSPTADAAEAARGVFAALRAAEGEGARGAGVRAVLLADLGARARGDEAVAALWERLHRAASGERAGAL